MEVALDKKITVESGSYFCKAEDCYTGDFDTLMIAAGIFTHDGWEDCYKGSDRFAIWEKASDTSVEPEDGRIGVAVYMPGAESVEVLETERPHLVATKAIVSGETLCYWFGSCWSKGEIEEPGSWFELVKNL